MSRYTGPKCKICKTENEKLFLKGEKCYTSCILEKQKISLSRARKRKKISEYGKRLREKQKLKRMYGLTEEQFRRYFNKAVKLRKKGGSTGDYLVLLLERRLDNIIRRIGWSTSINAARQMLSHGFIYVNNKNVNIPSFSVKESDIITLKDNYRNNIHIKKSVDFFQKNGVIPAWIKTEEPFVAKIERLPDFSELQSIIPPDRLSLIVEFYSR